MNKKITIIEYPIEVYFSPYKTVEEAILAALRNEKKFERKLNSNSMGERINGWHIWKLNNGNFDYTPDYVNKLRTLLYMKNIGVYPIWITMWSINENSMSQKTNRELIPLIKSYMPHGISQEDTNFKVVDGKMPTIIINMKTKQYDDSEDNDNIKD
jgi:hypothetical protein